ncbi:MAG: rhodanese-like domain-containing protein [Alphaproteobacteria bacterium]
MNDLGYAGDITPTETWERLVADVGARLLDVRTPAEWAYVGLPDLTELGKQPLLVPWMLFPAMQVNTDFVRQVSDLGVEKQADLLIICRSGQRSAAAAMTLTEAGFKVCYNVSSGFEGDKDASGHRGTVNGWKFDALPWIQG